MFSNPVFIAALSGSSWTPAVLFSAGEQGAWYDPSDFSTMFQDSAGATPVTAVEQPVGLMLDKSGRGNHASQSTAASRPVLSARVNLLTYSGQFDNAAWVKSGATITANQGTAPDGTTTADKFAAAAGGNISQNNVAVASGKSYTFSVWIKGVSAGGTCGLYFSNPQPTPANGTTVTFTTSWQQFTLTGNADSGSMYVNIGTWAALNNGPTQDILIWGADFRATNDGASLPPYQRVTTSTDYDTSGFPLYLAFDGVDDSLATGSIDFSATDKATYWVGARKLSGSGPQYLMELGTGIAENAFNIVAPPSLDAAAYDFRVATHQRQTLGSYASPVSNVLSVQQNLAGASAAAQTVARINSIQLSLTGTNVGTGNFINAPIHIGRRAGASGPFNGRLYSLIVRGAQSTDSQIASTENYVNNLTEAY